MGQLCFVYAFLFDMMFCLFLFYSVHLLGRFRILKMPMGNLEIAPNPENARNISTGPACCSSNFSRTVNDVKVTILYKETITRKL